MTNANPADPDVPAPRGDSLLDVRCSGVLLHPTSLPGHGIGTLGSAAHRWVDWLADAGQSLWQVLPVVPVDRGGSPYNGLSAMAGNPLLIDPERLLQLGLVEEATIAEAGLPSQRVDFAAVTEWNDTLLRAAHAAFRAGRAATLRQPFAAFQDRNVAWLSDYTLFVALREHHGGAPWTEWDADIRSRDPRALSHWRVELSDAVQRHAFAQFLFDEQWAELRSHAQRRGVRIVGDIPIFVAMDSADVWAHPELFKLDAAGRPTVVSGVPPDYFSETGQRWGNPLYRWDAMRERGYRWWTERFRRTLELVDIVRIDHFRGFEAAWEIPAEEETALHGEWRPGPGTELFAAVERELGTLPLVAEDLGLITPAVEALRDALGLPGMRVLHFAFDGEPDNPHRPGNHPERSVVYTGTHDNDTSVGWWEGAEAVVRAAFRNHTATSEAEIQWQVIRAAFESAANIAIVPLQDVLGLGSDGRMNTPGTAAGNWTWRFAEEMLTAELQERLAGLTRATHRVAPAVLGSPSPTRRFS